MNATYESPNRPAVAFNGIEGLRLDSTEPPTSGDFKPTPVLAYREC
ncbi:MAG: hypothetical protein JWM57_293, partial [Phycisphaerales bacterium]|nr:hypothetical protein [Phycisphaerales bacterium]